MRTYTDMFLDREHKVYSWTETSVISDTNTIIIQQKPQIEIKILFHLIHLIILAFKIHVDRGVTL